MLVRQTTWVFAWNLGAVACQALYFVLIARVLGVSEFGSLAPALAIVSIVGPFSGVGAGYLMVMRVARDTPLHGSAWASALLTLAMSAPIAVVGACVAGA